MNVYSTPRELRSLIERNHVLAVVQMRVDMGRKRGFFAELEHQRRMEAKERERLIRQAEREQASAEREALRLQKQAEREEKALYLEEQKAEAAERTEAAALRAEELDRVLVDGLAVSGFSVRKVRRVYQPVPFAPSPQLATAVPPPQWERYAPPPPTGLGKVFKGGYERAVRDARARFDSDCAQQQQHERARQAQLANAHAQHTAVENARKQEIDKHNALIDEFEKRVTAADPSSVEDYFELALEAPPFPDYLPNEVEVAYQPEPRKLLVIRELPEVDIIPSAREYTYVRTRDEITAKARPAKEIRQRYSSLVAQLVLRTMRGAFEAKPAKLVNEVAVNGHVSTRNKATGQPERPCLVSVSATREQFANLVLDELDPAECLRHLNALVSPHPWDLEAVRPIFDPDLSKYRLVDAHNVAAGLDARPVLLQLQPVEFEHLVRQLFEAMGMKAWVTQASRDDGLDAVAVNEDPIMGGTCVIQAKRYSGIVPADAVRALAGVMDDKKASRGVLITTSWFGKATHDFAARNGRIQLIEGGELKHLLAEHLQLDVVIGQLKRRRDA